MKIIWAIGVILMLLGCTSRVSPQNLMDLNGYWEIERVVFPDGTTKSYTVNTTIDFIQFDGKEGYRKKVQPQLNGTFLASEDAERFKVTEKSGTFIIVYTHSENSWEETLAALSKNSFEVINAAGISYHYKRYQPFKTVE